MKTVCSGSPMPGDQFEGLVDEVFPKMVPYIMSLRCLRGIKKPKPITAQVNFMTLSVHLKALLPTDWISIYHIAELEEKRRGLAIK